MRDIIGGPRPLRSNYGAVVRSVKVTRPRDDMLRQCREARPARIPRAKKSEAKREARATRLERTASRIDRERALVPVIVMADL